MVSSRGGKFGYVVRSRQDVYRALRRRGLSKRVSAAISNAGRTKGGGRSRMAHKAARTRRRRHR